LEKTLSIIKPDGVKKNIIGEVVSKFESKGLQVLAMRMIRLTKEEAKGFYAVHKERPFFDSLTDFMSSGPVVVMVLGGDDVIKRNRAIMGATNPAEAEAGTIRKEFADSIESNIVHGSDSPESAVCEINYFFNCLDICDR